MARPFAKYEGLGNDFILLDAAHWPFGDITPTLARTLCDRHTGIGGDGLLWTDTNPQEVPDARLVILNADGSRAEMCGNGLRCVAAWLYHQGRLAPGKLLQVHTNAGPRSIRVMNTRGETVFVEVDMGPVQVDNTPVELAPGVHAIPVDVGNPHAVVLDPVAESHRPKLVQTIQSRHDRWPTGANVEFVTPHPDGGWNVQVHERGVGWTRACGTGACAVAAATVARRLPHDDQPMHTVTVPVTLPGGRLEVHIVREKNSMHARLRGPARRVFEGTIHLPAAQDPTT